MDACMSLGSMFRRAREEKNMTQEHAVHVMAGSLSDDDTQSFYMFPDMGTSVGFSPEEWQMHMDLCRFAGIDDVCCEEAYTISNPAITARRMRLVRT